MIVVKRYLMAVSIGICILMSFGGLSFSTYLYLKLLKMKKMCQLLESKLKLAQDKRISLVDSAEQQEELENLYANYKKLTYIMRARRKLKSEEDCATNDSSVLRNERSANEQREIYETPCCSPTPDDNYRSSASSSFPFVSNTIKRDQKRREEEAHDDNKSLDHLLTASNDEKHIIYNANKFNYEKVSYMLLINYRFCCYN